MATFPQVFLKPGREKSLLQHHPWVFSGAIAKVGGTPEPGSVVTLLSHKGEFLAYGSWSPVSQLRCRVWSWRESELVDRAFFRKKLLQAKELRTALKLDDDAACRLVYSESDGLPGVIVDRFGDYAVVQFLSCGAEYFRQIILEELVSIFNFKGIYERSDASVRSKEGLVERCELAFGESIPDEVCFRENGLTYYADLRHGQKTGFYFDLREVRKKVEALSAGKRVLNAFAFTGGFACSALRGGALSVLNLDSSRPSLEQAEKNLLANGFTGNWENRVCDGFTELKKLVEAKEKFDLVILDPPKLVDSRGALERGCRAYQYLARCGFNLLAPGGIMLNMSCSGQMSLELLQKITFAAAQEAGKTASIIDTVRQAADHPVALSVPETFYLKGFITRVAE